MNYPLANDDERTSYRGEEDWKGKIVWMTPEKFLNLAAPLPDNLIDQKSAENLKHRFANNLPTDPLVLNVDMKTRKVTGHEGRHRAKVCIKMGIEKVPVLIYTGGGYTRVPKWTADQHRDVEDIDSFQKESVGFKEFFNLVVEGKDDNLRQAINILNTAKKKNPNINPEKDIQIIQQITDPYSDSNDPKFKSAKNYAHLAKLTKFYGFGKIQPNIIKTYYDKYMLMPTLANKPIDRFNDFRSFEQEIDSNFVADANVVNKKIETGAIYSDENIDVYLGDTKQSCIKYGQGTKYGLCISRNDSSNLFHHYRWDDELTTYFVYFKDDTINKPSNFIIIDATETPDRFSYNTVNHNTDKKISKLDLIKLFPQIEQAMNSDVFKHVPIEGNELAYYEKYYEKNISNFNTLEDQLQFVEMGGPIGDDEWEDVKNIDRILATYIEVGHDVPKSILDSNPKHKKRYQEKLRQRVLMNLDDNTEFEDYTDAEKKDALTFDNRFKESFLLEQQKYLKRYAGSGNIIRGSISLQNDEFINQFGRLPDLSHVTIEGSFYCNNSNLTSLEGAPKSVEKDFYCNNNKLTSLEGAPKSVGGYFYCYNNKLTSLEGAPKSVGGDFDCYNNKLTSLEGAPENIEGSFQCSDNRLTSLEGAPKNVEKDFDCNNNPLLKSLEGAPKSVKGNYYCSHNNLTSLKGSPESVKGDFECSNNNLTSLKGAPKSVGGYFYCTNNPLLTSLEGIPSYIGELAQGMPEDQYNRSIEPFTYGEIYAAMKQSNTETSHNESTKYSIKLGDNMRFKEFFKLYLEASVLPNDTRSRTKSYSPDIQKPLKDSDTIRVYHGFNNINDLFQTLKSGVSGQENAKRIYSYEGNNNPKGLFVTIALSVAKQFGQYVMEIHAPVRELEAPVWPGNGYTVQGGMAEYFNGPEDRETQRKKDRDYSSKSKHDSIKNSDRPELAEILFNSSEQQALFVGNLNNNSIRAIWANPTPEMCGSYCTYTRMSVKEFLKNYKPSEEFKLKNPHRILKPRDIFDIHKFVDILVKQYSNKKYRMSKEDIISSLKGLDEHDWLTYIWPAQLPDALKQIEEV